MFRGRAGREQFRRCLEREQMTMSKPDLVQLLCTKKLDRLAEVLTPETVNTRDSGGYSLLHLAARDLNVEVARLLVVRGADVNATDRQKDTALHYAADRNHFPLVQLLIEAGADPNP